MGIKKAICVSAIRIGTLMVLPLRTWHVPFIQKKVTTAKFIPNGMCINSKVSPEALGKQFLLGKNERPFSNGYTGQMVHSEEKQLENFGKKIRFTGFVSKGYQEQGALFATTLQVSVPQAKSQMLYRYQSVKREKKLILHRFIVLLNRGAIYFPARLKRCKEIGNSITYGFKGASIFRTVRHPAGNDLKGLMNDLFGVYRLWEEFTVTMPDFCADNRGRIDYEGFWKPAKLSHLTDRRVIDK